MLQEMEKLHKVFFVRLKVPCSRRTWIWAPTVRRPHRQTPMINQNVSISPNGSQNELHASTMEDKLLPTSLCMSIYTHPNEDRSPTRRPPRRAETLPVRFVGRDHDDIIEPVPRFRRRQSRLVDEYPTKPALRRQGSSYQERLVDDRRDEPSYEHYSRRQRRGGRDVPSEPRHGHRKRRRRRGSVSDSNTDSDYSETEDPIGEPGDDDETGSELQRLHLQRLEDIPIRRPQRWVDYDSEDESESDVGHDAYDFSLPRYSKAFLNQESTLAGSEPSLKTETESESQFTITNSKVGTTEYIYRSRYVGEGSIGGIHNAQLYAVHDTKKTRAPLFRWV